MLPWYMGGNGSMEMIFKGFPYQTQVPYYLELSLVTLGYFLEDFTNHVFFKERSSDFWEMNLHHSMTLTLITGMILQNWIPPGTIIIFLHTVPDAFITAARILSQT